MYKKILIVFAVVSLLFSYNSIVFAKQDSSKHFAPDSEVATEDGLYDVEGNSNLKVQVHVYKKNAKPTKPGNGGGNLSLQCDLTDADSFTVTPATGWHLPSAVSYSLNPASAPQAISAKLPQISANAYSVWNAAVTGAVAFTRGANTSVTRAFNDGQNIVAWGRTSGTALAVTYTWFYPDTGLAVETDTIFNNGVSWAWADQTVNPNCAYKNIYDVQNILTHELGHWMGLDDTYTAPFVENTMYGYGAVMEVKKNTLTTGDINGVQAIYNQ